MKKHIFGLLILIVVATLGISLDMLFDKELLALDIWPLNLSLLVLVMLTY